MVVRTRTANARWHGTVAVWVRGLPGTGKPAPDFAGAIDFDLCSPGPRLWDIAYTAYRYVPLMPPANADLPDGDHERSPFEVTEMCSRLDTFLAAYAVGSVPLRYSQAAVFAMAIQRLGAIAAWTTSHVARTGNTSLQKHAQMYRVHAQWIDNDLRRELTQNCR